MFEEIKLVKLSWSLIIIFTCLNSVNGQKEYANWLFKSNEVIDFQNGSPIQKSNHAQFEYARDGLSVVSDSEGSLLFYTDGDHFYDKSFKKMPSSLGHYKLGYYGYNNSSIVIKSAKSDSKYYIFSHHWLENIPPANNKYDMVLTALSMQENNGFGDILSSKVFADAESYSKRSIIACKHPCFGYWLLSYNRSKNKIEILHMYEDAIVSKTETDPIYQYNILDGLVNFVISNDNKRLLIIASRGPVVYYDFDKYTGILSKPLQIFNHFNMDNSRPIEIYTGILSPGGTKLYIRNGTPYEVWLEQYDISSMDSATIRNSKTEFRFPYPTTYFGIGGSSSYYSFGLGIDGKLYFASPGIRYNLPRINQPDKPGLDCDFDPNGLSLSPQIYSFTIPNPLVFSTPDIKDFLPADTNYCKVPSIKISSKVTQYDSLLWSDGSTHPSIDIGAPGVYSLTLYKNGCEYHDTMTISEVPSRTLNFGPNISLCRSESHTITLPTQGGDQIRWSDGSTLSTRVITNPGTYAATITTTEGCAISDTITITRSYNKIPKVTTKSLCDGETYTYKGRPYITGQTITDSIPALTGCDTLLTLRLDRRSTPAILRDTMTCTNAPVTIQNKTYMPGDTIIRLKPATTGCDTVVRMVYRTHQPVALSVSVTDSVVCAGATTIAIASISQNLIWSTGATSASVTLGAGTYKVTHTDTQGCMQERHIEIKSSPPLRYQKDFRNPTCKNRNGSIRLINQDTSQPLIMHINGKAVAGLSADTLAAGKYTISLTNRYGCVTTDSAVLTAVQTLMVDLPDDVTIEKGKTTCITYKASGDLIDTIRFLPQADIFARADTICIIGNEDRIYTITFTDDQGCTVTKTLKVEVTIPASALIMPNIVSLHSHNEDNAYFFLRSEGVTYDMLIYDRWGNVMHEAKNQAGGDRSSAWHPETLKVVPGVYVYLVTIYTEDGVVSRYGTVTVL